MHKNQQELPLDERIAKTLKSHTRNSILENTIVSQNPEKIPHIIGLLGPNRDGLTALMFLLLSHPQIERGYFQPHKKLIRYGNEQGPYNLNLGNKRIIIKESLGPRNEESIYDPINHLQVTGIPYNHQTWIFTLRDPNHAFSSWFKFMPTATAEMYDVCQQHTIDMYTKYKNLVNSIPLTYELFGQNPPETVFRNLLSSINLDPDLKLNLRFDIPKIEKRLILGEASDPSYYQDIITPTLERGKFNYMPSNRTLPDIHTRDIEQRCRESYQTFHILSKNRLNLR